MKTLITALAVTAILATSAVAKTQKTKDTHSHPSNSVIQTSVIQPNDSYCRYHYAHNDPDPIVRREILRDCRNYESGSGNN
jgi:hypothetical protein